MEQKTSSARLAIKWGVICGLAIIILSTVINISGLWKTAGLSSIALLLPLILFIYLSTKELKESNNGFMTFGEGLGLGTLLSVIAGLLSSIWSQIYNSFIDSTFMQQVMDFQVEQMEEQGLGEEQIEMALEMSSKFTSGGLAFLFGILFIVFFGFVISLIIAAIQKKNKPVF